jgi:hypothetical protein
MSPLDLPSRQLLRAIAEHDHGDGDGVVLEPTGPGRWTVPGTDIVTTSLMLQSLASRGLIDGLAGNPDAVTVTAAGQALLQGEDPGAADEPITRDSLRATSPAGHAAARASEQRLRAALSAASSTPSPPRTDELAAYLWQVHQRHARMTYPDRTTLLLARDDIPQLLRLVEIALSGHRPVRLYRKAYSPVTGDLTCGHDPGADDFAERHELSEDGDAICTASPLDLVCAEHWTKTGAREPYPCPLVLALRAATS